MFWMGGGADVFRRHFKSCMTLAETRATPNIAFGRGLQ